MIYFVYLLMCSCIVFVCYQCCICKIFLYKCLESLNKLPFQKRSNSAICLFLESQNHIFSISRIEMIQRWTVFCFCCCFCCCTSLSKEFQKGPLDGAWTVIPPPAPTRRPHLLYKTTKSTAQCLSSPPSEIHKETGFTSLGLFSPSDPGLVMLQYFIISLIPFVCFPDFLIILNRKII